HAGIGVWRLQLERLRVRVAATAFAVLIGALVLACTAAASTGPTLATPAKVQGTPRDGSSLRIYPGTWHGEPPIAFAYKWELCNASGAECATIAGAEAVNLKLGHEDVGHTLRGIVTATNAEGSATTTTAASKVVAPLAPKKLKLPTITGLAVDGQILTATNGIWTGTPPLTYTYQWQACVKTSCTPITGARSQTYRA